MERESSSVKNEAGHSIPLSLPAGLKEEDVLNFKPFNNWLSTLTRALASQKTNPAHPFHAEPYSLRSIRVQSHDTFGSGAKARLGFLKATADVSNASGESLPGSVFLRGPSVGMLVMLVPDDNDNDAASASASAASEERYVVLTVQPRVPAGSLAFVELPAGMVDDAGSFAGAAAKEMEEELGLEIHEDELTCLSEMAGAVSAAKGGRGRDDQNDDQNDEGLPPAMYPSAGGCDEHVTLYAYEKKVPRAQLREWSGKLTGLRDSGEKITLKLVHVRDLWREGARDSKSLAAVALWEGLRREGRI